MRRPPILIVLVFGILVASSSIATAQDDDDRSHLKLDRILDVLRLHTDAAGKSCLESMTRVHESEDQVKEQSKNSETSQSDRPHPGLDIARDVLGSDYETATNACGPDAARLCAGRPPGATATACVKLNGSNGVP